MSARIAVVILNWNGKHHLETFLPQVIAHSCPLADVIVADNASTDDSLAWLAANHPSVLQLPLPKNYGFAKGYNEALKQLDYEFFLLLNSDVEVTAHWLEPMISWLDTHPQTAACQPKIRMYANRQSFEYAGACGGWLDHFGYPFARGRIFDFCETDHGQYDDIAPVFWASGAAMLIRAKAFREVGMFDEFFFAHQEEIDLCWRLQLAGWGIVVCPQSVVYHVGGGTLPKGNEWKVFLNFRNNLVMLAKNLPWWQAMLKIPFRLLLDSVSAWKSLFEKEGIYFKAILEAHVGFFGWLLLHRHKSVFPQKRHKHLQGWYRGSVVWQHFVKGRKQFSEIVP
ncbi:MAG: glycosyltransferase family 2 protein [Flavihumibacter sp.]